MKQFTFLQVGRSNMSTVEIDDMMNRSLSQIIFYAPELIGISSVILGFDDTYVEFSSEEIVYENNEYYTISIKYCDLKKIQGKFSIKTNIIIKDIVQFTQKERFVTIDENNCFIGNNPRVLEIVDDNEIDNFVIVTNKIIFKIEDYIYFQIETSDYPGFLDFSFLGDSL